MQELSYDAWGQLRNPADQTVYTPGNEPELFLGRGYTGHEHLPMFGLVNMNARLYDPALGRFLSPDPYVQNPLFSQNFNRYAYALNNPTKYTDPTGEFIVIDSWVSGFFRGLFQGKNPLKTANQAAWNDIKIWGGLLFASDPNKNFGQRLWETVSRFTWQLPQTIAGFTFSQVSNLGWQVDKVDYWGGATVLSGNFFGSGSAITMGSYINGSRNLKANPNNYLFQHEYGHYLQSQEMGWAYLSRVGIPSLMGAANYDDGNHDFQPYEQDANRRAFMYFNDPKNKKTVGEFYTSEAEYRYNQRNGIEKGWNFYQNPMDVNHIGWYSRYDYYDYKSPADRALINSLSLRAKWYDYFDPFGLIIGTGNGIYYNKRRVR